jgi:hypothetical protein
VKAAEEGNPEPLAGMLFDLKSKVLKNVLTNTINGILKLLVNDKTLEDLVYMLDELDPDDLKAVLQTKVDDKSIYEHLKTIRDDFDEEQGNDQDDSLKTTFTEILQRGVFVD